MKRKTFNAVVELALLMGSVVFVLLLAGVDLGLIAG
jgi:hypothetical protein